LGLPGRLEHPAAHISYKQRLSFACHILLNVGYHSFA
jgi:hypothetical protein